MPTMCDRIEDVVTAAFQGIPEIATALDHEPQRLPQMPCVTLLLTQYDPDDVETGPGQDVTYAWRVRLYVVLQDYKQAQQKLKDLVPLLLKAVRDNPTALESPTVALADKVTIRDPGTEPQFAEQDGYVTKELVLRAVLTET